MKRIFFAVLLIASLPVFAQTEADCRKTLGVTWTDIQNCMSYLTIAYPDQFKGAVFGYLPAGQTQPLLGGAGAGLVAGADPAQDTIVWGGSTTKVFTHTSALIALERSGISLDSRLVDLPGVRQNWIDGDPDPASRGRKEAITLRQVLSMSAGLGERTVAQLAATGFFNLLPSPGSCYQQATGQADPNLQYTGEPGLYNECVYIPSVPGDPNSPKIWMPARNAPLFQLAFYTMRYPQSLAPLSGNRYPQNYSNISSIIAGWATESRTGQTLNTYAKANLFTPIGMSNTFYNPRTFTTPPLDKLNEGVTQQQINRIAHMWNKSNGVRDTNEPPAGVVRCNGSYWCDVRDWPFLWPEGGIYSTPRDMLAFFRGIRDNNVAALTPTIRAAMLNDQLDLEQAGDQSRTAAFAYARNGMSGFVEGQTEGSILHGGFPGAYMVYDPTRRMAWAFATQRVMRQKGDFNTHHFQPTGEVFAEARLFSSLVNTMVENQKADHVNFYFDAARAAKSPNQWLLRYGTQRPGGALSEGYGACRDVRGECHHQKVVDYYTCAANGSARSWYDLGPSNRPLTVTSGACPWKGTGSRTETAAAQFGGPFRMTLDGNSSARIVSNTYSGAYTISLFIRPHSTANASIISRSGEKVTYQVGIQNGQWLHSSWDTSGVKRTVTGGTVNANQWYHVVAKATRWGSLTLWVNGVQAGGTSPIGDFLPLGSYEYLLGLPANGLGSAPFRGDYGVIGVYNQEHTQSDIQRNCNGLKHRFPGVTCG